VFFAFGGKGADYNTNHKVNGVLRQKGVGWVREENKGLSKIEASNTRMKDLASGIDSTESTS